MQEPHREKEINKHSIRIPDLLRRSREKPSTHKQKSDSVDYGTDSKKCSRNQSYSAELEDMKAVIQSCSACMQKISQFKTKKPSSSSAALCEKCTQTTSKPFLINLIEERVVDLCDQNRRLRTMLLDKESELFDRQNEIVQIQDKFTTILYSLSQEISTLRLNKKDAQEMQQRLSSSTQTPSFLKALMMDQII